jgi:hypothetical protein
MPRIIGTKPVDFWENRVLEALKHQLPDDWVVLPSVMWTLEKNGFVRDGEADFVILAPNLGLIVLEVKGSKAFKVGEDGIWMRQESNGTWLKLRESPSEQATRNMHDLTNAIKEKQGWDCFPGFYSYIVIYPQGIAETLPDMFDESTLVTRRNISNLASRLRNSLEKRGCTGRSEKFTPQVVESIVDQLKDRKFHIQKVDTEEDVANDRNKIEQLTRQQFASLKGLFQLPSVAVIGPAGSGKTVLAMWRLKSLIEMGQKAVYVCYNRVLAESLRLSNPEHAEFIWNVDKLFLKICPSKLALAGQSDFHREVLPGLVMDKAHEIEKYDAIIVDEGQDFSEEQLIALLELRAHEAQWVFFADWKQDLYGIGSGTPIGAEVIFHLYHNCRNTIKINDTSNRCVDTKIESMPGMPIGEVPCLISTTHQAMKAWELAKQWGGKGSVVILSPFKLENSAMRNQNVGFGLQLSTVISDFGRKDVVFFSTIKSFKGMEADSVIVIDTEIPDVHPAFTSEDVYVACTRAKTRLAIISAKKNVEQHFKEIIAGV